MVGELCVSKDNSWLMRQILWNAMETNPQLLTFKNLPATFLIQVTRRLLSAGLYH